MVGEHISEELAHGLRPDVETALGSTEEVVQAGPLHGGERRDTSNFIVLGLSKNETKANRSS